MSKNILNTLLILMIFIDLYLCYVIFEPIYNKNKNILSISSLINDSNTNTLLIGLIFLNFLSFVYELHLNSSFFNILFISLINMSVLGTVLFKYELFQEEHNFFSVMLFINILLYMILSDVNYKLIYVQLILSCYCIYYYFSDNNFIFIFELLLLLNFAFFYFIRHLYIS